MSLEQKIEDLTAAVIALTAAMSGAQPETKPAKKSQAQDTATIPKSGEVSAPTTEKSSVETKPVEAKPRTYDEVKESILAISSKSRDKAVALLSRFGAKSGKDLTEDQYVKFYADAQRVIAGEYDPETGE